MNRKLRALSLTSSVRLAIRTMLKNLEAICKYCDQEVWLVWEKTAPTFKWTECGGVAKGSCDGHFGGEKGGDAHAELDDDIEQVPETMRSPSAADISTRLKRSV